MRFASLALVLLVLASPAAAQSFVGLTACCPNEVVTIDAAAGDTTTVAEIGTANDLFIATVGSLVLDAAGERVFVVRSRRVVAVDLVSGGSTDLGPSPGFVQLAGYDATRDRLIGFTTERDTASTAEIDITNYLLGLDATTGDTTRIAQVGRYVLEGTEGSGDLFATVTGPASGPRPTSSTPQTRAAPCACARVSKVASGAGRGGERVTRARCGA